MHYIDGPGSGEFRVESDGTLITCLIPAQNLGL
jgi:hypothetical protein